MKRIFGLSALLFLITGLLVGTGSAAAEPWKFGVMADTQWTAPTDPAGKNPNGVPVSIIEQLNEQFIKHGVKFVIQVGDLTENGNDADIATRAEAVLPLYDAKIGFFPMRGNHEMYAKPAGSNITASLSSERVSRRPGARQYLRRDELQQPDLGQHRTGRHELLF